MCPEYSVSYLSITTLFNSDSYEQPSVTALSEFCDYVRFV